MNYFSSEIFITYPAIVYIFHTPKIDCIVNTETEYSALRHLDKLIKHALLPCGIGAVVIDELLEGFDSKKLGLSMPLVP